MLRQLAANQRRFSKVVKYKGQNINVTPHNKEQREGLDSNTFYNTFNIGYEGFSKPWNMPTMYPVVGNRGEFLFLAIFFPSILIFKRARAKNEEGIRQELGFSTNRYEEVGVMPPSQI